MSKKLLVVFGATGNQGGSIVNFVLADPELSQEYAVRAITRDASKPAARALATKGATLATADTDDAASLAAALNGAHTACLVTTTAYGADVYASEWAQGKAMADAAVAAGVQHIIFSTLPSIAKLSGGALTAGKHFDVKADVEAYIRGLPVRSTFYAPASFMQNFHGPTAPRPVPDQQGLFAIGGIVRPETRIPLIDTASDVGKWVGAILAEPDRFAGKTFCCATEYLYSMEEVAAAMSKKSGKKVVYNQFPVDVFKSFLPPSSADELVDMFLCQQDYGYYGPDQAEKIKWAADHARGRMTTLDEYLEKNPLQL